MKHKYVKSEFPASALWQLKKGNEHAFDRLYHTYKGRLYGNLLKTVKSEEIAEELLQKVFIRVWERHRDIDPEKTVEAYLYRIAGNIAIDFFRKTARDRKLKDELIAIASTKYSHVEEDFFHRETTESLSHAIASLSPKRRRIFELVKLDGKSYEEVAHMLDISTSTVNDHIVKATHTVKEYFILKGDLIGRILVIIWIARN